MNNQAQSTIKRLIATALPIVALIGTLSACGTENTAAANENNDANARTIIVGSSASINPVDFVDEDGNLDGYEIAVLKEADKLLPQYKFEYKKEDWKNLFISLESNKVNIASNFLALNSERKAKFAYTEEPTLYTDMYLATSKNAPDIKNFDDFAGKKVLAIDGTAETEKLEEYNKKNPDAAFDLVRGVPTWEQVVASIDKGAYDAYVGSHTFIDQLNSAYGDKLKANGPVFSQEETYYLLNKDESKLTEDLNKTLQQLRKNGTLKKLSEQYLGADRTEKLDTAA